MRRWRTLPWIRLWVLCLLCLLLVSVLPFPGTAQAHVRAGTQPTLPERPIVNYSCGGNACYAQVTEQPSLQPVNPGSNFWGVQTTITPVQLYAQTGSINEDMWLSDTFLDGSTCPSTHSCWIEAGFLY
jgi:hypothetical protein